MKKRKKEKPALPKAAVLNNLGIDNSAIFVFLVFI